MHNVLLTREGVAKIGDVVSRANVEAHKHGSRTAVTNVTAPALAAQGMSRLFNRTHLSLGGQFG